MTWMWWKKSAVAAQAADREIGEQLDDGSEAAACGSSSLCGDSQTLLPRPVKGYRSCCERCGACCAFFTVSFPSSDLEGSADSLQLRQMSLPVDDLRRVMRGTNQALPRCIALQGQVGIRVSCAIYAGRPSTCRNFKRSWEDNWGNSLCDRARCVFGLDQFSQY